MLTCAFPPDHDHPRLNERAVIDVEVVASEPTTELLITTNQAADLAGRSAFAVRSAIKTGRLRTAGKTEDGHHRLRPTDVLAWDRAHPPRAMPFKHPWEQTADAITTLGGSATAEELGAYLDKHPGNVRKHLTILAAQDRARRRDDGQWVLTAEAHVGAA
jgi:hypothetical protein